MISADYKVHAKWAADFMGIFQGMTVYVRHRVDYFPGEATHHRWAYSTETMTTWSPYAYASAEEALAAGGKTITG